MSWWSFTKDGFWCLSVCFVTTFAFFFFFIWTSALVYDILYQNHFVIFHVPLSPLYEEWFEWTIFGLRGGRTEWWSITISYLPIHLYTHLPTCVPSFFLDKINRMIADIEVRWCWIIIKSVIMTPPLVRFRIFMYTMSIVHLSAMSISFLWELFIPRTYVEDNAE